MGEVGCGILYPTFSLLTCYNSWKKKEFLSILEKMVKKALKLLGKAGEWRRGMVDGSWVLWMARSLIFRQHLPLFFLRPAKNQQVNKLRWWWYAQKSNKLFYNFLYLEFFWNLTKYRNQKFSLDLVNWWNFECISRSI